MPGQRDSRRKVGQKFHRQEQDLDRCLHRRKHPLAPRTLALAEPVLSKSIESTTPRTRTPKPTISRGVERFVQIYAHERAVYRPKRLTLQVKRTLINTLNTSQDAEKLKGPGLEI
jgi:hypothetical protein